MIIGGLEKLSLIDYPGNLSAVVFTQNCNFRCHFCYNPMLVWPQGSEGGKFKNKEDHSPAIAEDDLLFFLKSRAGKLDAVVVSGGEPTLHNDLPEFIKKIKKLGFKIKLDTNGTNPAMLAELIKNSLLDYIAMDLKAPLERYEAVTGVKVDLEKIRQSIKIIKASGLSYEFRTTAAPGLIGPEDIAPMGEAIKGADAWYLQSFISETDLVDSKLEGRQAYSAAEMETMRKMGEKYAKKCVVR